MTRKTIAAVAAALMLGTAPAALAQGDQQQGQQDWQAGQTMQQGQQQTGQQQAGQQQAGQQMGQLRQMTVSDLLDREIVDQQGQEIGTISGILQRENQRYVEIERRDSDRVDLLPLNRVTVEGERVVAQMQDGRITGAQEFTEERQAQFDDVDDDTRVQVRQQQDQQRFGQQDQQRFGQQDQQRFGQQDQQRFGQQDQQRFGQQDQQRFGQQDQQRFGQQGQQQFGQQQQLENALRQAGFFQIQRVGQNVVQARSPDGQTVYVHMHGDTMATGTVGQQQWQQDQQRFGQQPQQQWRQDQQQQRWQGQQ